MRDLSEPVWFLGDLSDPWVAAIADALPASVEKIDAPGDLPDGLFETMTEPSKIVLHRSVLTKFDLQRVARWRGRAVAGSRMVLCFGPHLRHSELGLWTEIFDAVIPEATARETVLNHLARPESSVLLQTFRSRIRVAVVSELFPLRESIAEICAASGFQVHKVNRLDEVPSGMPAVWDAPTLDPAWAGDLRNRSLEGPVIALLSFADRSLVARARRAGAISCLDMPLDLAEIPWILDRVGLRRADERHEVPPSPTFSKRPAETGGVTESRFD